MKIVTHDELMAIIGCSKANADLYLPWINKAMSIYGININDNRIAAFLAQIGHETMSFNRMSENMNYSMEGLVKTWPTRFNNYSAATYARQPEAIANMVYANRMGNRNEASGDGWKYRGRGMMMLTGHNNYATASIALSVDLTKDPDLLRTPEYAALSASWYWYSRNANELADKGKFEEICLKVNGGRIGLKDRMERYERALTILKRA